MIEHNIFDNYWAEVESLLNGSPTSKRLACSLNENPPNQFDGVSVVDGLYKSLTCDGWESNSYGNNWNWRPDVPSHSAARGEVPLEREVVAAGTTGHWTCQMSTSSGVQGPNRHKRRAIDLVRRAAADRYAFIELKVESDNPLYAIFEILSYALAYQHARQGGWKGTGTYNVMQAQELEFLVLAPNDWYEYKKRGKSHKYDFDWLASALGTGLNSLRDVDTHMRVSYRTFRDLGAPGLTASGIVEDSSVW